MNRTTLAVIMGAVLAGTALFAARSQDQVVRVIDGDSIVLDGRQIRLYGIDAPELAQTCQDETGWPYACGREAKSALEVAIAGHRLTCRKVDRDRYGREIAVCEADSVDVNAAMVKTGHAVAYLRYSSKYLDEQNAARGARRGIWRGTFIEPEQFRHAIR